VESPFLNLIEKRIRLNTHSTFDFGTGPEIASSRRTRATLGMNSYSASGKSINS
jgi:hypothetical protein